MEGTYKPSKPNKKLEIEFVVKMTYQIDASEITEEEFQEGLEQFGSGFPEDEEDDVIRAVFYAGRERFCQALDKIPGVTDFYYDSNGMEWVNE
jgi:hypothetical protein